ncbi:MAG: leucyl/phenylalanyl-tRNA--protein transferase [Bacteroidetes bacterium]|nr:leucyl/phenylalanyl-tRNA--protein transferase [Bacteroidota bacterium]
MDAYHFLSDDLYFPPAQAASPDGILAIGGDLSPERLLLAYRSGIFPWYNRHEPIVWWHPPKRMVLFPDALKIPKSLRSFLRKHPFKITVNQAFREVMEACAATPRHGQADTWIQPEMIDAYEKLQGLGHAVSVEVWQGGNLVGGLYGVDLGRVFCGESMFSKVSNASKVAFVFWVTELRSRNYQLIDCQVYTDYLASFGAKEISRADFMRVLETR